ncbi:MAG TPA: 4-alpha-glucanotransferase [Candidatus Angelobacter sp.]|nr:4-alpha-glucanotransferase [Candidatus Angelobacter sp.]
MTEPIVATEYTDAFRRRRAVSPEARASVLAAMGLAEGEEVPNAPHAAVVSRGAALPAPGELILEDGTALGRLAALPPDCPYGYHHLHRDDGIDQLLIAGPRGCHLPAGLREWGWSLQLAATRSQHSWGIGDLDDLRRLASWSAGRGAGFVSVSPLGAPNPGPSPEPSPYYPSTRRFGSLLHVAIDPIAVERPRVGISDLAQRAHALNAERRIERDTALALKMAALERLWADGAADDPRFHAWRAEQGAPLERWATFAVLTERHGPGWQGWPGEVRSPRGRAVADAAASARDRVAFHAWVQWWFDRQLAAASEPLRRLADMPVGVDPGGFDAWDWQEHLAIGASVGAPPDRFNTAGQDWGLPPFIPHRLREAHYRPFIDTIRAQLRHAGGLRIDHVLGLFRQWWVPGTLGPGNGAYVQQPTDELLAIVALESHRARAVIVGEDLGTVPRGVRAELRRRRLLSTRLVLFERVPPSRYPRQALAAVTTHDLPTIAGALSGRDLEDQRAAGIEADPESLALLRGRLLAAAAVPDATSRAVSLGVHRALAASASVLVAATLEDALGVEERVNQPGTVAPQRDNWNLALPRSLEDVATDPAVADLAAALRR